MKKLTCKDLGGACGEEITGETFEELGENCKNHVLMQIQAGDTEHLRAVAKMKKATPEEQQAMLAGFQKKFDEAEEVSK
ncbi:DUF1059 domain-containing protein [Candidatus Kaiserbacteria bacterium CG10_big_fil_rev_8_21_14_0_10_49_17]|uniref:DUF1059 domain-containing protein n=1 Tax=Candidatus Kaiserbacteria bacterium CG10_big_fil_rev_8_21_14_0_10_49_17 TaxID=1974609 RepID=A0A2M6WEF7_9BACT|nr:MAG: DUF1059 domain-containing protein [Candidatus Kaiserbacteria bacterium CG10_big_fil_rev_8_21_14_0_10_49_17]